MSHLLVVGSLAYDTISTPMGKAERTLGGSANYFSLAAGHYGKVRVVGVVGSDYSDVDRNVLQSRGVDLRGLEVVPGKTFHWEGKYQEDMNEAITVATELNVFENFAPNLIKDYRGSETVFLANIDPDLQLEVLNQVESPRFVASDTMNFWIDSKEESLIRVLEKVDCLLINEQESMQLTGAANGIAAARAIAKMGPKAVVVKRGEYGFALYFEDEFFILPAFPVEKVVDPTGAGDTFAGGFMGYLSNNQDPLTRRKLRHACVHGVVLASHTVQDFGVNGIQQMTESDRDQRLEAYSKVIWLP